MAYEYGVPGIFKSNRPDAPQEDEVYSWLKGAGLGAIGYLGNIIDTPGSFVRGLAAGEPGRAFTGLLNFGDRVSGKELAGLDDNPDSYLDDAGGIATEILLDPLTYLTLGASALVGKSGPIAKAAGLMPKAVRSGTELVKGAAELGTKTTLRELEKQAPENLAKILTAAEGQAKPGLLKRAVTKVTGHEFQPNDLVQRINDGLAAAPGAGGIVDEPLRAGVARLQIPGTEIGMNLGDSLAPKLDQFGDTFRYGNWLGALPESVNPLVQAATGPTGYTPDPTRLYDFNPIRTAAPYFQKSSWGSKTALGQLVGQEATQNVDALETSMRGDVFPVYEQWKQVPGNDTPQMIQSVQESLEQGAVGAAPQSFIDPYRQLMQDLPVKLETDRGIPLNELTDLGYMQRQQLPLPGVEVNPRNSAGRSRVNDPSHDSMIGREEFLRNQPTSILSRMSIDPEIVQSTLKPDEVRDLMLGKYGYSGFDQSLYDSLKQEVSDLEGQIAKSGSLPHDQVDSLIEALTKKQGEFGAQAKELANAGKLQDYMQNSVGDRYIIHGGGFGLFDSNPIELLDSRLSRTANAVGEADALFDAIPQQMFHGPAGADERLIPMEKALDQLGFAVDGKVTDGAINQIAKRIGKAFDPKGFSIPADVVEELARVRQAFKAPQEVNDFWKAIDKITAGFKTFALMRPAFHTRNLVSGQVQNAMNGLFSPFGTQAASRLMKGEEVPGLAKFLGLKMTDSEASREISKLAFVHDVIPGGASQLADMPGTVGKTILESIPGEIPVGVSLTTNTAKEMARSAIETAKHPIDSLKQLGTWFKDKYKAGELNPLKSRGVIGDESQFVGSVAQEQASRAIEGYNRLGAFIEGIRKGIDPAEAAKRVKNIQYDYRNLTDWEKSVPRRGMPFYSFQKNALPQVVSELAHNPGGPYGQLLRGINELQGEGQILPDHLKNTLAIPYGTNDEGDPRYITGLGLMPESSYGLLGGLLGGDGLGSQLTGMLNPMIKGPLEAMTGRSFFQDRELIDQDPVMGRIFSNIFGGEPPNTRTADQLLMNAIPTPLTIAKQLTDTRKGVGAKATNLLTGIKTTDVPDKVQEALGRQQLQELLRTMGGHKYEQFVMPKDELAKLPPDQQEKARVIQALLKELSERAKKRAKAG
jgi:hypothetical protein